MPNQYQSNTYKHLFSLIYNYALLIITYVLQGEKLGIKIWREFVGIRPSYHQYERTTKRKCLKEYFVLSIKQHYEDWRLARFLSNDDLFNPTT